MKNNNQRLISGLLIVGAIVILLGAAMVFYPKTNQPATSDANELNMVSQDFENTNLDSLDDAPSL